MASAKQRDEQYLEEFSIDLTDLSDTELLEGRSHILPSERPFLGLFSRDKVAELLEKAGITIALRRKGFYNFTLGFDTSKPQDQRLWIEDNETREKLLFMRLHLGNFLARDIEVDLSELRLLFIDWLLLQNPRAEQKKDKLFPGQKYPGLGLFPEVKQFLYYIVRDIHLDGAANLPEFFHDAVLFADKFLFVHPESQGIFEALRTQGRFLPLRHLSNLIHKGLVQISKGGGPFEVFEFRLGEMLVPHSQLLQDYFNSDHYKKQRKESSQNVRFLFGTLPEDKPLSIPQH
ncbi:MAG: hypothetical protein NZM25_06285 [Leptospiraceae bacterium]|nr:hypothetical protein [Leptospiraceae bacterium]MDW8306616.1 hypothetical protein [Leptospiraceae bacterium]